MDELYSKICFETSKIITSRYSTSFSVGVRCLSPEIRNAIYGVYGFVRVADEIVDTFHEYDKELLLDEFESEYYRSLERGISTNPVINSFQAIVRKYQIEDHLVQSFLKSMRMDISHTLYSEEEIKEYIYGSAEVVGLICLTIFVNGDKEEYERLKPSAKRLGAAFQKINFLRDLKNDSMNLHRIYFPVLKSEPLTEATKRVILKDIYDDYREARIGIRQLPECARLGVYTAYLYYLSLTKAIENTPAEVLQDERIRISNVQKARLLIKAFLTQKFI
ncbi:MAG: phytoene/squalene synthase family protein [Bacteroidales bacterium]|nr:phytoene/squalene synthase family protein [Bacteroidales bacterium]